MNQLKKVALFVGSCFLMTSLTGCQAVEEEIIETISGITEEIPQLPSFVQEPEKNIAQIDLPAAYRYEADKVPKVRNQEGTNTCWAFASLSALESSKDEDVQSVYSVDHLRYQNPFDNSFEEGGSYMVTMSYLLSWRGPVLEELDPFDGESEKAMIPAVHVQEVRQIEPKDYQAIKRFVYLYGGVESALYLDFDEYMELLDEFKNYQGGYIWDFIDQALFVTDEDTGKETYFSYCYQGEAVSNHDVVIVGWDDHYPAENFVGNVTTDGAFVCQNSWGERFGDQGLFYVSYEDVNIGEYGVVYSRVDSNDNYDKIYQSDLCGYTAQIGYEQEECWFANVYTAEEAISLRAAGFYATGEHTEYEIYVVSDFEDEKSFKKKEYLCNGFLEDAGYYTINFPQAVDIEAEADFALVVKIKTKNDTIVNKIHLCHFLFLSSSKLL